MSLPLKPWEVNSVGVGVSGSPPYVANTNTYDNRLYSSAVPYPGSSGGCGIPTSTPNPPLPPRPGQQQILAPTTGYNRTMYNPYAAGMGMYNGPTNYNAYGSYYNQYTPGYSQYGYGPRPSMFGSNNQGPYNNNELTFSQLAEESSAGAFQSIESFVNAFGSISAMLESTFQAVVSSFRAVVGVADHLGRVKQLFSALAIFRFIRWCYRRILYLIGISKIKPEQIESLWNSVSNDGDGADWAENVLRPKRKPSSWPILMFLGFIFAGPYLMWKLLASLKATSSVPSDTRWASGETEHFVAVAEYDFESVASERELKLKKGQRIRLAPAAQQPPEVKGWVLASDGVRIGLVPTNYIKIIGKKAGNVNAQRQAAVCANLTNNMTIPPLNTPIHKSQAYTSNNNNNLNGHGQVNQLTSSSGSISDSETIKATSRSSSTSSLFIPEKSSQSQSVSTMEVHSEPELNKLGKE